MWKLKARQAICIVFIIVTLVNGYIANAKEMLDIDKKASLEINHSYMNKPLKNVEFSIYKVANIKSPSKFEITDSFKNYSIDFSKLKDESDWYLLFDTLASYVNIDNIVPTSKLKTDAEGKVLFSDLDVGIYLVVGETSLVNNNKYVTKPYLVSLPTQDKITGNYIYDVKVTTKCEEIKENKTSFVVQKKWANDKEATRPKFIKVSLYGNKSLYETVKLSEENNWRCKWNDLDEKIEWTVIEESVSKDYTVTYEKYDNIVIVTNTAKESSMVGKSTKTGDEWPLASLMGILLATVIMCMGMVVKRKEA